MILKITSAITPADIKALMDNPVPEDRTTEYKRDLPTDLASSRDPFLAAVCAFANPVGGDW